MSGRAYCPLDPRHCWWQMLLAYAVVATLANLLPGCTYVNVPGRFTVLDTKDNSLRVDAASYDPNTGGVTLKGFDLTNNASGPINAYGALIAGVLDRLDLLAGRLVATSAPQPPSDTRLDRILAALDRLTTPDP